MSIDISQWRATIGNFNLNKYIIHRKNSSGKTFVVNFFIYKLALLIFIYHLSPFLNLLLQHGDIETNPGPRGNHSQYFSFCHWNLNSLPAHNYAKVPLLQAFNAIHKFDLICLSESYLNSSITMDEKSLIIDGYKLIRADHPSDTIRGGVCIYHKESISVNVLNISQLSECLVCELSIQNKKGYFVTLYRSPIQSHDDFETFLKEFDKLLTNIT